MTNVIEKKKILEQIKLNKSYNNYYKLINRNLPYKYAYLDEWLLKKSKLLLEETTQTKNKTFKIKNSQKYRVYNRGTIIKVDFGVNLGSEMSQVHFAIVLNNYDNQKNNVLTVIPLTSKQSKFNINLGPLVINELINKIKFELLNMGINEEFDDYKNINDEDEIKIRKLYTILNYYKSNFKNTYACCSLITTISKTRIFKPINEYDIIGNAKCNKTIMDKLDNAIIERFTKN